MKPKILVLGANGKTGNATALQLLEKGYPVRAFVRKRNGRSEKLEKAGAEIFIGNLINIDDINQALAGVQRAYFVAPWEKEQLNMAMSFAVAAKNSDSLEAIVAISQWLSHPTHPSKATRETYLTDEIFSMLPNVSCTTINVGWLADNYMPDALLMMIAQLGLFPFPLGDGKTAPISNEDIAKVIVTCLENPEQHAGERYRPTGPDLLSPQEIASTFSRILNKKVIYQDISRKLFLKALRMMGMPKHMQSQLTHYTHEYQIGTFEKGAPNNVFEKLVGRKPEAFETIAKRYLSESTNTKTNFTNKCKAIFGFARLLLTPAENLENYQKEQGNTKVNGAQYSLVSDYWQSQH